MLNFHWNYSVFLKTLSWNRRSHEDLWQRLLDLLRIEPKTQRITTITRYKVVWCSHQLIFPMLQEALRKTGTKKSIWMTSNLNILPCRCIRISFLQFFFFPHNGYSFLNWSFILHIIFILCCDVSYFVLLYIFSYIYHTFCIS